MSGVCANTWQEYGCEWGIGYLWHWMNWIGRFDVAVLALMFAYIVIVFIRYYYLCRVAEPTDQTNSPDPLCQQGKRKLATDLRLRIRNLKSIATSAPFLGLSGTCVGILSAFRGVGMEKHAALIVMASEVAASLVTTAAGIIVAITAVWSHNYLCTSIEQLEIAMPRRRSNQVRKRRSLVLPDFATMAALTLGILVAMYSVFPPSHYSIGYSVRAASNPSGCCPSSVKFRLRVSKNGGVKFGCEDVPVNELATKLSGVYAVRAERILYLSADSDTTFQTVAEVIDVIQNLGFPEDRLEPPQLKHTRPVPVEVRLIADPKNIKCPGH